MLALQPGASTCCEHCRRVGRCENNGSRSAFIVCTAQHSLERIFTASGITKSVVDRAYPKDWVQQQDPSHSLVAGQVT